MRTDIARLLVGALLFFAPSTTQAQSIVINHSSLPLFDRIPQEYLQAAQQVRMLFIDRSVGVNTNDGLNCYAYSSPQSPAPSVCRQWGTSAPEPWAQAYPRTRITFGTWPSSDPVMPATGLIRIDCSGFDGLWTGYLPCALNYIRRHPEYQVVSYWPDYLTATWSGDPLVNFFSPRAGSDNDMADYDAFIASSPASVWLWTTSLMRADSSDSPGTLRRLNDYNAAMRNHVASHAGHVLIDAADILSHRPDGTACVDSSSGQPNICTTYTSESVGGHLTYMQGKGRIVRAMWIALAIKAGWDPDGGGNPPAALDVTTTSLPNGAVAQGYSAMLGATGGLTPYIWSITSGSLPAGLSLTASTGRITGTPTTAGTRTFTVQVRDSQSPARTDSQALQITVLSAPTPLNITTTSLSSARRNRSDSATVTATGGTAPYTWSLVAGALPPGLALNATSGVISGTATTLGTYAFTVRVRDSQATPGSDTQALSIEVRR